MKRQPLPISHPDQLRGLSVWPWRRMVGAGPPVIVDERVSAETRAAWNEDLRRTLRACGCDLASIGLALGLAVYGVRFAFHDATLGIGTTIGGAAAYAAVGLAAGKLLGLARAQRHLKTTIAAITDKWQAPPLPPPANPNYCG